MISQIHYAVVGLLWVKFGLLDISLLCPLPFVLYLCQKSLASPVKSQKHFFSGQFFEERATFQQTKGIRSKLLETKRKFSTINNNFVVFTCFGPVDDAVDERACPLPAPCSALFKFDVEPELVEAIVRQRMDSAASSASTSSQVFSP